MGEGRTMCEWSGSRSCGWLLALVLGQSPVLGRLYTSPAAGSEFTHWGCASTTWGREKGFPFAPL